MRRLLRCLMGYVTSFSPGESRFLNRTNRPEYLDAMYHGRAENIKRTPEKNYQARVNRIHNGLVSGYGETASRNALRRARFHNQEMFGTSISEMGKFRDWRRKERNRFRLPETTVIGGDSPYPYDPHRKKKRRVRTPGTRTLYDRRTGAMRLAWKSCTKKYGNRDWVGDNEGVEASNHPIGKMYRNTGPIMKTLGEYQADSNATLAYNKMMPQLRKADERRKIDAVDAKYKDTFMMNGMLFKKHPAAIMHGMLSHMEREETQARRAARGDGMFAGGIASADADAGQMVMDGYTIPISLESPDDISHRLYPDSHPGWKRFDQVINGEDREYIPELNQLLRPKGKNINQYRYRIMGKSRDGFVLEMRLGEHPNSIMSVRFGKRNSNDMYNIVMSDVNDHADLRQSLDEANRLLGDPRDRHFSDFIFDQEEARFIVDNPDFGEIDPLLLSDRIMISIHEKMRAKKLLDDSHLDKITDEATFKNKVRDIYCGKASKNVFFLHPRKRQRVIKWYLIALTGKHALGNIDYNKFIKGIMKDMEGGHGGHGHPAHARTTAPGTAPSTPKPPKKSAPGSRPSQATTTTPVNSTPLPPSSTSPEETATQLDEKEIVMEGLLEGGKYYCPIPEMFAKSWSRPEKYAKSGPLTVIVEKHNADGTTTSFKYLPHVKNFAYFDAIDMSIMQDNYIHNPQEGEGGGRRLRGLKMAFHQIGSYTVSVVVGKKYMSSQKLHIKPAPSTPPASPNNKTDQFIKDGEFGKIETLSAEQAKAVLAKLGDGADVDLDGLTSLDEKTAKALAKLTGLQLSLDGLTSLDEKTAKALTEVEGLLLSLDGLTSFDEKTAKALAKFEGDHLFLHGLSGDIGVDIIKILAGLPPERLGVSEKLKEKIDAAREAKKKSDPKKKPPAKSKPKKEDLAPKKVESKESRLGKLKTAVEKVAEKKYTVSVGNFFDNYEDRVTLKPKDTSDKEMVVDVNIKSGDVTHLTYDGGLRSITSLNKKKPIEDQIKQLFEIIKDIIAAESARHTALKTAAKTVEAAKNYTISVKIYLDGNHDRVTFTPKKDTSSKKIVVDVYIKSGDVTHLMYNNKTVNIDYLNKENSIEDQIKQLFEIIKKTSK